MSPRTVLALLAQLIKWLQQINALDVLKLLHAEDPDKSFSQMVAALHAKNTNSMTNLLSHTVNAEMSLATSERSSLEMAPAKHAQHLPRYRRMDSHVFKSPVKTQEKSSTNKTSVRFAQNFTDQILKEENASNQHAQPTKFLTVQDSA